MTQPTALTKQTTVEQFDAVLRQIADQLDEALEAGNEGRVDLLMRITGALEDRRAEAVDAIVKFLIWLDMQQQAALAQAALFTTQAERLEAAADKVRVHIQDYIDDKSGLAEDERKLVGETCKLYTQRNSGSRLVIPEPAAVPVELHNYTLTVTTAATDDGHATLCEVRDFAESIGAAPSLSDKKVPDNERIRKHLDAMTEPWGRIVVGRHLRMKPSLTEARKAMVKK